MENTNNDQTFSCRRYQEEPSPQDISDGNQDFDGAAAYVPVSVNDEAEPTPQSDGDDERNGDSRNVSTSRVSSDSHLSEQEEPSLFIIRLSYCTR